MRSLVERQKAQNFVQALRSMAPYGCGSSPLFESMHSRVGSHYPGIPLPIKVLLTRPPLSTPIAPSMRCQPAVYRVWLKGMTGTYPTYTYLKRVGLAKSPDCPYCAAGVPETLTHFACVCPQFREARTSAHNQVRQVVSSFLTRCVGPKWTVYEETRMGNMGLNLSKVPQL